MSAEETINGIDRRILEIIQQDGRISNAEIARQVGMAPSAIFERLRKLEERGVIKQYTARLGPEQLGCGLLAFIFVRSSEPISELGTAKRLAEIPEVLEVHHITGEDCYLVKVRTSDTTSLGCLLRERFGAIESITTTRTTIVLETLKETTALPVYPRHRENED
jgi:Lrp/AsnC family leucine-responsive transcriptional regulator